MRCLEKGTALSEEFTPRDEWQWLVPNNMWSVIFFIMSEHYIYLLHLCRSWLFSLKSDVLSWKFKWCLIPPTPFFVPPKGCEASVIHLIPENHHGSQKTSLCCSINCHLVLRKQSRLWSNVMDTCRNLGSHLQPCVHIYKTMFSIV